SFSSQDTSSSLGVRGAGGFTLGTVGMLPLPPPESPARDAVAVARMVGICAIFASPGHTFPRLLLYFIPPDTRHGSMPRRCHDRPCDDDPGSESRARRAGMPCVRTAHANRSPRARTCAAVHA